MRFQDRLYRLFADARTFPFDVTDCKLAFRLIQDRRHTAGFLTALLPCRGKTILKLLVDLSNRIKQVVDVRPDVLMSFMPSNRGLLQCLVIPDGRDSA